MTTNAAAVTARAADLARRGRYDEATQALDQLGGRASTDVQVLDLLARIHAQRGEMFDADECWALAQKLDGGLPAARDGRRRIAALQARRLRPRTVRVVGIVVLAGVVVTGAGVVGAVLTRPQPGPDPTTLAALNNSRATESSLAHQVGVLNGQLDQTTLRTQQLLNNLAAAFAGDPAFSARVDAGTLVVTFPVGVFSYGVQLSRPGGAALDDLANRLHRFSTQVSVTVVGHTENTVVSLGSSGYADNVDLGLARARTAAERMSQATGLPLSTFALSSDGMANPPFSNATAAGRAQNRTVTVAIRPE